MNPKIRKIPGSEYIANIPKKRTYQDFQNEYQIPKFEKPKIGAGFIIGIFFWLIAIVVFLVVLYFSLFARNASYLAYKIAKKSVHIPWWFSLLVILFLFPVSLAVILIGAIWKMFD